jgi:hypothetical protein
LYAHLTSPVHAIPPPELDHPDDNW